MRVRDVGGRTALGASSRAITERPTYSFFSDAIKDELVSFLAFLAARFSFKVRAGFFLASLLLFRSLDMVILQMGEACIYIYITVLALYSIQCSAYWIFTACFG